MIRKAAFVLLLTASTAWGGVAEDAAQASAQLQQAVGALQAAEGAKDRVAALTQTIKAYEEGLAALREALRQAELREAALTLQFQTKRDRIAQLLGVLSRIDAEPGPLLLLHPTGPLGTVRSGMMLADVTPALAGRGEWAEGPVAGIVRLAAVAGGGGADFGARVGGGAGGAL